MAASVAFLAAYGLTAVARIGHPYELEFMEGEMLRHVARLLAGEPIYAAPSLDFVAFLYTPLYYAVCALPAALFGAELWVGRAVSLVASLGAILLLGRIVRHETGRLAPSVVAAGLFTATYAQSGAWLDLARIDSLFLLLLLATVLALRLEREALAAVLIGSAFLVKQTALPIGLSLLAYLVLVRRRGRVFGTLATIVIGGSTWWLDRLHDGWYVYYTFHLPRSHKIVESMYVDFWVRDLLGSIPVLVLVAPLWLLLDRSRERADRAFYAFLAAGVIGSAWLSRLHSGGYVNALIPVHACLALLAGLALGALSEPSGRGRRVGWTLASALLVQFALLAYDPRSLVPDAADVRAGDRVVERIARAGPAVFVPHHGLLAERAGKPSTAHVMAMVDVVRGPDRRVAAALLGELRRAIEGHRFSAVVLDAPLPFAQISFAPHYRLVERLFDEDDDVFWPVSGARIRPELLLLPRDPPAGSGSGPTSGR